MNHSNENVPQNKIPEKKKRTFWWWLMVIITRIILPVAIITAGILYALYLIENSVKSKRQPPTRQARLVEVVKLKRGDYKVEVKAMGLVIPAREIDLKPQVSGKITQINPELLPGGIFQTGQSLMRIEPADYELQVEQRQYEVDNAQNNLKLEQGNQTIAQQEFELLGDVIDNDDKDLVLRQPQLLSLQNSLQAAQAQLKQANLDLDRTHITAPFNCIIKEKYVDLGATVQPTTTLVTLTGIDEYWIELQVFVDQLKWIKIPRKSSEPGSPVRIFNPTVWGEDSFREGKVLRLGSSLETSGNLGTSGRLAKLLVSVKDPLALSNKNKQAEPLLIGSYVHGVIECENLTSVIKLNRELLRDGDKVWLCTADNTLKIHPVKIVFGAKDYVLISDGINPDSQVIVTDIAAAVDDMPLRLPYQEPSQSQEQTQLDIENGKSGRENND
ncbi:MAG: HlyD family efflux transporter periplasmic adaptor subunit [Sedimentisphaerales bacterium]|nr:HlyD family efflux transporter periplasmic adaptor subunit [Sedimentisphaerales bacterium]